MAIETANRAAESLLPTGLMDAATREAILSNSMPSFLCAGSGSHILWSSHEVAKRFGYARAGEFVQAGLPALAAGTQRIAVLGRGIAPDAPKRLERLRFNIGFRSLVLTALCEPIRLTDGSLALLVSLIEARPVRTSDAEPTPLEESVLQKSVLEEAPQTIAPPEGVSPSTEANPPVEVATLATSLAPAAAFAPPPVEAPVPALPAWINEPSDARKTLRFVFALDPDGIVERVTPPLADAVGAARADIVGHSLAGIVDAFDEPAAEEIRSAILGGQTWSGISVRWPVAGTNLAVPIDLSALPLISGEQGLTGYSGFGRCHLGRAETLLAKPDEAEAGETLADPPEPVEVAVAQTVASETAVTDEDLTKAEPETHQPDKVQAEIDLPADPDLLSALEVFGAEDEVEDAPAALAETPASGTDAAEEPRISATSEIAAPDLATPELAVPDLADTDAPSKPNIVSLRTGQLAVPQPNGKNGLSMAERNAFREIARALGAKFDLDAMDGGVTPPERAEPDASEAGVPPAGETQPEAAEAMPPLGSVPTAAPAMPTPAMNENTSPDKNASPNENASPSEAFARVTAAFSPMLPVTPAQAPAHPAPEGADILDRLPIGLLVLRGDEPLFANRTLLDLTGYPDFRTFLTEDGARAIFRKSTFPRDRESGFDTVILASRDGEMIPVDAHLQLSDWQGGKATLVSLRRAVELEQGKALRSVALDLKRVRAEAQELRAVLDTATDGVITLDEKGRILSLNGAAEALFGLNQNEVAGGSFTTLLLNESHADALDYFEGLSANGVRSVLNDGRDVFGREKKGGRIPLFMTLGRISDDEPRRYCAVLRDLTSWKRAEAELTDARRAAETASAKKSDFLAKISHEIRTPMNAIIGFAEVMMEERLGPVGNAKYTEYLGDIRTSGKHVVSLVNDLLDLAKIEAGRMEMNFAATDLNAILASAVSIIQPQANANRVLVRMQLQQKLPPVVADERSIRQIILNMLSNATRFTESGGQVILATTLLESGEAVIRIRDTGVGMSASEIEQALEPYRQVGTRRDHGGTGLGLPLTKALVEANRANFVIRSTPGEGTMVEITFPSTRVLAE